MVDFGESAIPNIAGGHQSPVLFGHEIAPHRSGAQPPNAPGIPEALNGAVDRGSEGAMGNAHRV